MQRALLLTTAAAVLLPLSAHARTPDDPADPLDEVVVTATRLPAIAQDTPGARVLARDAIDRRGAVFAADILSDVPGLSVVRSGAFGGVAQVRIRGAGPGKTLVLVDGVPVNDPAEVNGAFDFGGFDLADVERIEILSGPQSSLWGSDAIGGVIAFTTRETDGLAVDLEAGSYGSRRARLAAGMVGESRALSAWVSHTAADGISAADARDGNPERDGLTSTTVGVRGRYAVSPAVSVDGSLRWTDAEVDLDGYPAPAFVLADTPDRQTGKRWSGVAGLELSALGLQHRFSVSAYGLDRETVSDFPSVFDASRRAWRWQAEGTARGVDFVLGAEREETEGRLSTGLTGELGTSSAFATARLEPVERLSLTGALRHDATDDFGARTTGRLSAAFEAGAGVVLSAAWGTGFKAPSISQAVCDYCFAPPPWPALAPETAEGWEAAVGWRSPDRRLEGRATLYRLQVEDQIAWVAGRYINIAETATDGVELEGRARLGGGFDLTLAYGWTDARDETSGDRLLRVPEHAGSATLGWTGDRLTAALTVRAESEQADSDGFATVERPAFLTANLTGSYALTDAVALTARIENLADERYQQVFGYGEPGRSAYVGIRLRY